MDEINANRQSIPDDPPLMEAILAATAAVFESIAVDEEYFVDAVPASCVMEIGDTAFDDPALGIPQRRSEFPIILVIQSKTNSPEDAEQTERQYPLFPSRPQPPAAAPIVPGNSNRRGSE